MTMVTRQNCAFVTFTSRPAAETAAERSYNKLIIKGRRLKIMWGKSQAEKPKTSGEKGFNLTPVPGLPGRKFDSPKCLNSSLLCDINFPFNISFH